MTRLKEYLFYKNKKISEFALEIGITRAYLNRIVLGQSIPSKLLAREIERLTNGEVKIQDMIPPKE